MVDTSSIDLACLIEQHAAIRFGKAAGTGSKRTRKGGPCPFCGLGSDRFAVFVNEVPQHYYCGIHGNGCGAYGDAIKFVREYLQIDFYEACELLELDPDMEYNGPKHRNVHTDDESPCKKWMDRAELFCMECKSALWSDVGKLAREWLYSRGFTDAIIQRAGLGLNLNQGYQSAKEWGVDEDFWIPRGIVIPWPVEGNIWKVNIRRSDKDIAAYNARLRANGKKENAAKYIPVTGGSNGLYGVDQIQSGQPLIVVEGEFDRLALLQATERRVAVVATGSTGHGHGDTWVNAIKQASPVLIAFDDDENRAGDKAATFWTDRISHAMRWLPWRHDVNDMLLQGFNIPQWVALGVEVAAVSLAPAPCEIEHQGDDDIALHCSKCGRDVEHYDADGIAFCSEHFPGVCTVREGVGA